MEVTTKLLNRFSAKYLVQKNGCWQWTASTCSGGYGTFNLNGKTVGSHRVSYLLHKGDIPKGLDICHTCDNVKCVNPDHLFLGTHRDNMQDMILKKRGHKARGSAHSQTSLTDKEVLEIRYLYSTSSYTMLELGSKFRVSKATIHRIVRRIYWTHI